MTYSTNDMYIACAFIAAGQKLLRMEPAEDKPHEFVFVFDNQDGIVADLLDDYYDGQLMVDALTLTHTIKDIKTRVMQARDFGRQRA